MEIIIKIFNNEWNERMFCQTKGIYINHVYKEEYFPHFRCLPQKENTLKERSTELPRCTFSRGKGKLKWFLET